MSYHNSIDEKQPQGKSSFQENPLYVSPNNSNLNKLYNPADTTDRRASSVFGPDGSDRTSPRVFRVSSNISRVTGGANHRSWIQRMIDGVIAFLRGIFRKPSNTPQVPKTGTSPKVVINPSNSESDPDSESSSASSAQIDASLINALDLTQEKYNIKAKLLKLELKLEELKSSLTQNELDDYDKQIDELKKIMDSNGTALKDIEEQINKIDQQIDIILQKEYSFINERIVKLEEGKAKLIAIANKYRWHKQEFERYNSSTDVFEKDKAIDHELILEEMNELNLLVEIKANCTTINNNLAILRQIQSNNLNQAVPIANRLQIIDHEDLRHKFQVLDDIHGGPILPKIQAILLEVLFSHNQLLLKFKTELGDKIFNTLLAEAQKDLAQGH